MSRNSSFVNDRSLRFVTTRWSLVLQAKDRPSSDTQQALADLCRAYWYPIYALIRRKSRDSHEAQYLTQGFFARLLEKQFLDDVDPAKGCFRAFLLAAVNHFLANEWDKDRAIKRGGGLNIVSFDARSLDWDSGESRFLMEPSHHLSAARLFERHWAIALLDRVLGRLRDEYVAADKPLQFEIMQPFLSLDRDNANYADAAQKLDLSEASVRVAAHRFRKRYRELLRDEIAHTVANHNEIENEIRHLFEVLKA